MHTSWSFRVALMGGLLALGAGCGLPSPDETAGTEQVSSKTEPLSAVPKGGLAFVRLDGVTATADVTNASGLVGLWSGSLSYGSSPLMAVQGPDITSSKPGYGSFLTYDWNGAGFSMTGKSVTAAGQPSNDYGTPQPTFQNASHVAAIPGGDVFFYDSTSRTAEIWRYSYVTSDGYAYRWVGARRTVLSASFVPTTTFTGLGSWTSIVGYKSAIGERGVLFFDNVSNSVWRGFFDVTLGVFKFEAAPPIPGGRRYTDVAFVEGVGHLFYHRGTGATELLRYGLQEPGGQVVSWGVTNIGGGYDKVVGSGNSHAFFFNSTYGMGLTFWVPAYAGLSQYGFTPDWTTITRVQ